MDAVKWSNFHITVQTNSTNEDVIDALRDGCHTMTDGDNLWRWLKQYNGEQQVDFTDVTQGLVERVRLRVAFEHGGTRNPGVHAHIIVEVAHRTMVQVNVAGIRDIFRKAVGAECHVWCRFLRGEGEDKDFCLRYITKEVPEYHPRDSRNAQLQKAFRKT